MLVVGLGAVFAGRSVARAQALEDSERTTQRLAQNVVAPLWPGYPPRSRAALSPVKKAVAVRMADGSLREVTVWSGAGQVLFSNKAEDIGRWPDERPEQLSQALRGDTTSDFEDNGPEADPPLTGAPGRAPTARVRTRLVEVYTPLRLAGQPPMVLEAYFSYEPVGRLARRLLAQILPVVLVLLLILQLVQVPTAVSLARRVKRHERDRSRLLERALSASDRERVRFAADLHDGPIQDLAGIGYALGAVAPTVVERHAALMARVQDALQRSIESLRGLMTDLYPPDLAGNLGESIAPLANRLRDEGVDVQLDLAEVPGLGEEGAAALYRVARESLANVQKHAQAQTVRISLEILERQHGPDDPWVRLRVADDGVGVDPTTMDRRAEGHLGLRLLVDRVQSLGGVLVVTSAVGEGTTVQADLPLRPPIGE
jgi:two-component system, NarL family, sensor kinase